MRKTLILDKAEHDGLTFLKVLLNKILRNMQ